MRNINLRKEKKLFKSDCCESTFKSKSNGLWTYHVCDKCNNKTIPVKGKLHIDLYGRIKRKTK